MPTASEFPPIDHGGPVDRPFQPFSYSALEGSITDRFEAIARRFSTRVAVSDCVRSLTYSELAILSDRIAAAVAVAVADRQGPVAILLPRDVLFPAAMLGVLAVGRGYVPLDVSNPAERNQLIATQSGAAAVVCAGELAHRVRSLFAEHVPVVDIDTIGDTARRNPMPRPASHDLAYIVYTSGSTGSPKGAYHNHRNLLHDVMQQTNTLHLNEEDRVALVYSPAVIAAIREIFMTLLNGASLHILPPQELQSDGLVREIRARRITILRTVPILLRRLAESLAPNERLDSIRVVGLGSQRVDWTDFDVFRRHFSLAAFLIVGIGATECGGNFCHWFVDQQLRAPGCRLPIGRILPDAKVTIADEDGRPVADGEIGEFVVASDYLALGYWRDPDLTARAFTVDPGNSKTRIFKTGDMGRMRPDGLLEYSGRNDQQIKLRGHRIEIGEIEFALGACAGVEDAAVVVKRHETGLPHSLIAYVEPKTGIRGLLPRDLLSTLAKRLPAYMVPARLHVLEKLPRLPNLKIDRVRLAELDIARQIELRDHAPPTADDGAEPAKIENVLRNIPEVADAAVIVRNNDGGDPRSLVAYAVLRAGNQGLLPRHLLRVLARKLPGHLLPAQLILLDKLPHLPNLAVDRVRLEQFDAARPLEVRDRREDPLIDKVAQIYEAVLRINGASADDNVDSLGGDSLQAITIQTELERQFGIAIPEEIVEQRPSIRQIARFLTLRPDTKVAERL
jgi:amino acid adenylation domain-containing protein